MEAYENVFAELSKNKYEVRNVFTHFFMGERSPSKVNVALRIDCDHNPETIIPIVKQLKKHGLTASVFFLPSADKELIEWARFEGMEVGLHSNHFMEGKGLMDIKRDVRRLGLVNGGMTFHASVFDWYLYRYFKPSFFGLKWHDGCKEYCSGHKRGWCPPNTHHYFSDHMLEDNGWNRVPWYPLYRLSQAKRGESVHIVFHSLFPIKEPDYLIGEKARRVLESNVYAWKKRLIG